MRPDGGIKSFVEKPKPGASPSNWAMPGRYVFEPGIIEALERTPPGVNGEIQLTDAMQQLLKTRPFFATPIHGERFDTGDKIGYIMANVSFALQDPVHGKRLRNWLKVHLND